MDWFTIVFQIINLVIIVGVAVALSIILYNGAKIMIKKGKEVDKEKNR